MNVQTRLCDTTQMVVVHRVFRREFRLLALMVAGVEPGDTARSAVVSRHLTEMVNVLHHHHTGEDELLWPLLQARADLPDELLVRMDRQHEQIGDLLAKVEALVPGWSRRADPLTRDALVDLLKGVSVGLDEHLNDEEGEVLPVVERYVTEQEWAQLGKRGMDGMSKPRLLVFLGYIFEEASDDERALFLAKLPPPARFAYRIGRSSALPPGKRPAADGGGGMRARWVLAAFASVLVLSGCGSSSSTGASVAPTGASASVRPSVADSSTPSPASQAAASTAPPSSTAAPASPATTSAAGESDAAACRTISDSLRVLTTAAQGPDNPGLKEMTALIKKLRGAAPSAIRGDLQVIADFDQHIVDAVLSGKQPEIKETPQLTAAMEHEASWTATHCGHG